MLSGFSIPSLPEAGDAGDVADNIPFEHRRFSSCGEEGPQSVTRRLLNPIPLCLAAEIVFVVGSNETHCVFSERLRVRDALLGHFKDALGDDFPHPYGAGMGRANRLPHFLKAAPASSKAYAGSFTVSGSNAVPPSTNFAMSIMNVLFVAQAVILKPSRVRINPFGLAAGRGRPALPLTFA